MPSTEEMYGCSDTPADYRRMAEANRREIGIAASLQRPPRDAMLVAYAPGPGGKQDGLVVLGATGPGFALWIGTVSPNLGQWWYEGVPLPPTEPAVPPGARLWVWEGAVEPRQTLTGHDQPDQWTGTWRAARVGDLAVFGVMPELLPNPVRIEGSPTNDGGPFKDWSAQDGAVLEGGSK